MITSRLNHGGSGLQNAAISFAGQITAGPFVGDCTEEWNGSAWSTSGALSTNRYSTKLTGAHSHNAMAAGGRNPGPISCTEVYTGYVASASFGRVDASAIAGSGVGLTNSRPESFLSSSFQIERDISGSFLYGVDGLTGTIGTATGVWSAGGALNIARHWLSRAGTQNAALAAGGSPSLADSEEYNGSAWSEGSNMINGRYGAASDGSQNAAWVAGGYDAPTNVTCTEHYNGTTWATDEALSAAAVYKAGFGTTNSAVVFGGFTPTTLRQVEEYNGSAWSFGGDMQIARGKHQGAGSSQLSGLSIGGYNPNGNCTEHYDGTAWSAGGATSITRKASSAAGSENSALVAGSDGTLATEEYDGSVWSSGGTLNDLHRCAANATGTQAAGLYFGGGYPSPATTCTEHYDSYHIKTGASCFNYISATSASINSVSGYSANYYESGSDAFCGTSYGTMLSGSGVFRNKLKRNKQNEKLEVKRSFQMPIFYTDPVTGSAGEIWYNAVDNALKFTFDYNAWSAGGALLIDRHSASHAGSQNAALAIGGIVTAASAETGSVEEYNGSAWSIGGAVPIAMANKVAHGTQNAALAGTGNTEYYEYNGTSWSEIADHNSSRDGAGGGGSQNAAIMFGGYAGNPTKTEAYNGMSWTVKAELIAGRGYGASGGVVNAAILAGGLQPGAAVSCTEHYDGSTWSAGGAINHGRYLTGGSGNQDAIVIFGDDGDQNCTEEYNGTTWNEVTGMITVRKYFGSHSSGNQSDALATGGKTASPNTSVSCTEEYSATYVKTVCLDS